MAPPRRLDAVGAATPTSRRAATCHPPLALAPRRLYTSPMRNPTSACPGLPDAARGISQRSRNCPESGPPYPQNGSCWTRRIVSAAGGFEADSFPKIEKLEQKLGVQSNRRSSARPEGPSPRRETFAQPRHSRTSPAVIPAQAGIQGGEAARGIPHHSRRPQPSPHKAVAPATRPKSNQIANPTPKLPPRPQKQTIALFPLSSFRKREKTLNYPPKLNIQTRPPAPPCPNPRPQSRRAATGAPGWRGLLHPPNLALHGELRKRLPWRKRQRVACPRTSAERKEELLRSGSATGPRRCSPKRP